jgi:transposase
MGSQFHRSQVIRDCLGSGVAAWLHPERLPVSAPDLNPDEGIRQYLKHVELRNRCYRRLADLRTELRLAIGRLRHKRGIIRAGVRRCDSAL